MGGGNVASVSGTLDQEDLRADTERKSRCLSLNTHRQVQYATKIRVLLETATPTAATNITRVKVARSNSYQQQALHSLPTSEQKMTVEPQGHKGRPACVPTHNFGIGQ